MPCDYLRDDERLIIRLTATDPVRLLDMTTMVDRQLAEGAWSYGMLVDLRHAILSLPESQALQEHLRRLTALHGPPGPVALVTRKHVGNAQRYASRSQQHRLPVQVFWDIDDAGRWLSTR